MDCRKNQARLGWLLASFTIGVWVLTGTGCNEGRSGQVNAPPQGASAESNDLQDNYMKPEFEELLRQFARFAYELHERGVYHKDFSAGNILITIEENRSSFFLIDLNRMKFIDLDLDLRMKNLSRLSEDPDVMRIIAGEYAKISGWDFEMLYGKIMHYTTEFRKKYNRRVDLKRRLLGREIS